MIRRLRIQFRHWVALIWWEESEIRFKVAIQATLLGLIICFLFLLIRGFEPQSYIALWTTQNHKVSTALAGSILKHIAESLWQNIYLFSAFLNPDFEGKFTFGVTLSIAILAFCFSLGYMARELGIWLDVKVRYIWRCSLRKLRENKTIIKIANWSGEVLNLM